MDFNTPVFLAFFAAVAVLNYILPRVLRPLFLLVASYVFYLYKPENAALVALLVGATVVTWAAALAMDRLKSKAPRVFFVIVAFLACGGFLFFYKYFGFFDQMVSDAFAVFNMEKKTASLNLAAPLGLSYFTFAALGYVIDVYRRKYPAEKNPLRYALFVSFFPCIFTGPIERYDHMAAQFKSPRRFDYDRCAGGAFRVLWGYVKKMVIADNLAMFVSSVYSAPETAGGPQLVLATLIFSMQLYMDFSGCCDIAIGGAHILGYDLLENFNSPFLASSFSDFWRRWHMSLTGWFREYLYFPLGGSRKGVFRQYLNLIIVFLVSGMWHGAAWGYVLWGFASGVMSVVESVFRQLLPRKTKRTNGSVRVLQSVGTYLLFTVTLVFFVSALYQTDWRIVYAGMSKGWAALADDPGMLMTSLAAVGLKGAKLVSILCATAITLAVESQGNVALWIRRQSWSLRWPLYYALAAMILFFAAFGQSAFIYQQY